MTEEKKLVWEAVLNGNELETYDPVIKITIVTEFGNYDLSPMECTQLVCRIVK